jgi:DNA-binding CsgD family transcriptional regulator
MSQRNERCGDASLMGASKMRGRHYESKHASVGFWMRTERTLGPLSTELRLRPYARRLPDLLSAEQWEQLRAHLGLSVRQSQILKCAFHDERDSAIAARLGASEHTVHTQRIRLFRKLGVTSMAQAIAIAATRCFEMGILMETAPDVATRIPAQSTSVSA